MKPSNLQKKESVIRGVESANSLTIFLTVITDFGKEFLIHVGKYIFFPLAALMSWVSMGLAWKAQQAQRSEKSFLLKAIVETITAVAMTMAVAGALLWSAAFGVIAFYMLTATIAANALYNFSAALFCLGEYAVSSDIHKQQIYLSRARVHLVSGLAQSLVALSVGGLLFTAQAVLAILGVIGSAMGVTYAAYHYQELGSQRNTPLIDAAPKNPTKKVYSQKLLYEIRETVLIKKNKQLEKTLEKTQIALEESKQNSKRIAAASDLNIARAKTALLRALEVIPDSVEAIANRDQAREDLANLAATYSKVP